MQTEIPKLIIVYPSDETQVRRKPTKTGTSIYTTLIPAFCACCCGTIFVFLVLGILFCVPILEIVYGSIGTLECTTTLLLNLNQWLVIKGLGTLLAIYFVLHLTHELKNQNDNENLILLLRILLSIISIFLFCWIIVGGILYWRDCSTIVPELNSLVCASVVMGLLGISGNLYQILYQN